MAFCWLGLGKPTLLLTGVRRGCRGAVIQRESTFQSHTGSSSFSLAAASFGMVQYTPCESPGDTQVLFLREETVVLHQSYGESSGAFSDFLFPGSFIFQREKGKIGLFPMPEKLFLSLCSSWWGGNRRSGVTCSAKPSWLSLSRWLTCLCSQSTLWASFCHLLYHILLFSVHSYLTPWILTSFVTGTLFYLASCLGHSEQYLLYRRHSVNTWLILKWFYCLFYLDWQFMIMSFSEIHTIVIY